MQNIWEYIMNPPPFQWLALDLWLVSKDSELLKTNFKEAVKKHTKYIYKPWCAYNEVMWMYMTWYSSSFISFHHQKWLKF